MHSGRGPRHARVSRRPTGGKPWRSRAFTAAGLVLAMIDALALPVKALGPSSPTAQASPALVGAWVKATHRHPPPSRTQPVSSGRLGRDDAHPLSWYSCRGAGRPSVRLSGGRPERPAPTSVRTG
jgi:hypothetical protein